MISKPNSALVIVGHGSTVNPDSSGPTLDQAEAIRREGIFGEVYSAEGIIQLLEAADKIFSAATVTRK